MRPTKQVIRQYDAGGDEIVFTSKVVPGSGPQELELDGSWVQDGVAVMDELRNIELSVSAGLPGLRVVIIGDNERGQEVVEAIDAPASDAFGDRTRTVKPFKTVRRALISDGTGAAELAIGSGRVVSREWIITDFHQRNTAASIVLEAIGIRRADIELHLTLDNIQDYFGNSPDPNRGSQVGSLFDRKFPDFTFEDRRLSFTSPGVLSDFLEAPITAFRMASTRTLSGDAEDNPRVEMTFLQAHHRASKMK